MRWESGVMAPGHCGPDVRTTDLDGLAIGGLYSDETLARFLQTLSGSGTALAWMWPLGFCRKDFWFLPLRKRKTGHVWNLIKEPQ